MGEAFKVKRGFDVPPACEATSADLEALRAAVEASESRDGVSGDDRASCVECRVDLGLVCRLAALVSRLRGQGQDTLSAMKHLATEVVEASLVIGTQAFAGELCDILMCCFSIAANEGIDLSEAICDVLDKNLSRVDPLAD